nr:uncharacterized protein LOC133607066 [Nerophis lumbriciformis]
MPRAKGHRRALAARTKMAERQSLTPIPLVPEFVARRGTGFRHRVRRWPTSDLTGRQVKFVPPAFDPEKKTVFVIGDFHLRGLVDGDVALPKVPLSFSFLFVPGGGAAALRTEVGRLEFPWTPDVVCVLAPSNDLGRGPFCDAAVEFGALLTSVRSRWPKVFVLDFPPRLNKPVGLQDLLRQEHHRVTTRMGAPQRHRWLAHPGGAVVRRCAHPIRTRPPCASFPSSDRLPGSPNVARGWTGGKDGLHHCICCFFGGRWQSGSHGPPCLLSPSSSLVARPSWWSLRLLPLQCSMKLNIAQKMEKKKASETNSAGPV